jgi:hypothetical protein
MTIFSELDHRLSVVKRWGIVHTLQTQSVAEHAFNVTRISDKIAFQWFGITDAWVLLEINRHAQHHDDIEAVMGDIPSMIKDCIDEAELRHRYRDIIPMIDPPKNPITIKVVKMADILEAIIFLNLELSLGNRSVYRILEHHDDRLRTFMVDNNLPYWGHYIDMIQGMFKDGYISEPYDRRLD